VGFRNKKQFSGKDAPAWNKITDCFLGFYFWWHAACIIGVHNNKNNAHRNNNKWLREPKWGSFTSPLFILGFPFSRPLSLGLFLSVFFFRSFFSGSLVPDSFVPGQAEKAASGPFNH
jgi:hypothetical protein